MEVILESVYVLCAFLDNSMLFGTVCCRILGAK